MPLLSDTMTEGKIVAWNKKLGDTVKSDDVLAEVETDKTTMEVVGYERHLYISAWKPVRPPKSMRSLPLLVSREPMSAPMWLPKKWR